MVSRRRLLADVRKQVKAIASGNSSPESRIGGLAQTVPAIIDVSRRLPVALFLRVDAHPSARSLLSSTRTRPRSREEHAEVVV